MHAILLVLHVNPTKQFCDLNHRIILADERCVQILKEAGTEEQKAMVENVAPILENHHLLLGMPLAYSSHSPPSPPQSNFLLVGLHFDCFAASTE